MSPSPHQPADRPRKHRHHALPLAVAGTLLLAACSGEDADTSNPAESSTSSTESTEPAEPSPSIVANDSGPTAPADTTTTQPEAAAVACDAEPEVLTTTDGTDFVRTPDSCFDDLPGWPYEPEYVEIDGLRQAYVDVGPADGEVVLLLHGQPSWSYLYRDMIPVLSDAGYRVIAMDHLGMGRSDKPIELASYSYLGHNDRLEAFIDELGLTDINLFVQDWGSVIGLRIAGLHPDLFATITVGDGALPVIPDGVQPFPPVENPDEPTDVPSPFAAVPDQQVPFYDGCELIFGPDDDYFGDWIVYAMTASSFQPSEVVEAMTWFDLTPEEEAAYDAPFPSRIYMSGPRSFPSLSNELPGQTAEAWEGLTSYEKPFLTLWADNDPGNLGRCEAQQILIDSVPGAAGQPHDRLPEASHFLQSDQGIEIATRLVDWYASLDGGDAVETAAGGERIGYELLEQTDDGTLRAWVATDITAEEFDALELPDGWSKNQPRESAVDGDRFLSSPRANGDRVEVEHFGHTWLHTATVTDLRVAVDDEGVLSGALVEKEHEISFEPDSTAVALLSPDGDTYVRVTRDSGRASDVPTLPAGWEIVEIALPDGYTTTLAGDTLVIRTDNQDSFQGPVTGL